MPAAAELTEGLDRDLDLLRRNGSNLDRDIVQQSLKIGAADVITDPHVVARNMLVEMPRSDEVTEPILIPGNPVKMSKVAEGPETRVPWVGEHTDEVLTAELGLSAAEIDDLRTAGVIT